MIKIRPYEAGDEQGFQVLDKLLEVHPWNRRDLANWEWKYKGENPAGTPLIFVAEDQGEMIAHFAAIPMLYYIDGEIIRGSHSTAMMTKPEFQNRGLVKFVADKLFKELICQKISFTYGYPNDNAYDLHKRHMGYDDINMQPLLERKLHQNIDIQRFTYPTSLSFQKIDLFDNRVNDLWETAKGSFKTIVIRDDRFLNWRYISRPDIQYHVYGAYDQEKLVGYCVLKLYQEDKILRGHFIDLFTIPGEKMYGRFLLQKGLEIFWAKQVDEVNLWMQGSLFFLEIVKEFGFKVVSSRPLICRFNLDQDKFRPLLTAENWYFTMGDTLEIY